MSDEWFDSAEEIAAIDDTLLERLAIARATVAVLEAELEAREERP